MVDGTHPLNDIYQAIDAGNIEGVKIALGAGADPNEKVHTGFDEETALTHLFNAKLSNDKVAEILRILVDNHADVNAAPILGNAIKTGNTEAVKILLEAGTSQKEVYLGNDAIIVAAEEGMAEMIPLLVQHGADPNMKKDPSLSDRATPLGYALQEPHTYPEVRSKHSHEIDYDAVRARNDRLVATITALIKAGARITPEHLEQAVQGDQYAKTEALLNGGADPNGKLEGGKTVLHTWRHGRPELLELLIQRGADVNAITDHGDSVLHHLACEDPQSKSQSRGGRGDEALTTILLDNGADPNAVNRAGRTALHMLAASAPLQTVYDISMVSALARHGASTDIRDNDGKTPNDLANESPLPPDTFDKFIALAKTNPEAGRMYQQDILRAIQPSSANVQSQGGHDLKPESGEVKID